MAVSAAPGRTLMCSFYVPRPTSNLSKETGPMRLTSGGGAPGTAGQSVLGQGGAVTLIARVSLCGEALLTLEARLQWCGHF